MNQDDVVLGIEKKFRKVLASISIEEHTFNRRLRSKTKKVAELLAQVAEVRRDMARKSAEADQEKGGRE